MGAKIQYLCLPRAHVGSVGRMAVVPHDSRPDLEATSEVCQHDLSHSIHDFPVRMCMAWLCTRVRGLSLEACEAAGFFGPDPILDRADSRCLNRFRPGQGHKASDVDQ